MSNVEFLFKQRSNILYGRRETEYLCSCRPQFSFNWSISAVYIVTWRYIFMVYVSKNINSFIDTSTLSDLSNRDIYIPILKSEPRQRL